jgi:transcriptional regulator with XRE-family HTH domain
VQIYAGAVDGLRLWAHAVAWAYIMTKRKKRQPDSGRKKSADERGPLLRGFRKVYDVTLDEMAKLVGLSQPMLTRFETGTRNISTDAWARLLIAMDKIEKERGAETKARFEELNKKWFETFIPDANNPLAFFELPTIEAEICRIADKDQSRQQMKKAIAVQLPGVIAVTEEAALADIRRSPGQFLQRHLALAEWCQKILALEAQGYVLMPKAVEEERDQLKVRVAELEQELKIVESAAKQAYDELLPRANRRIAELEQELARKRTKKREAANG